MKSKEFVNETPLPIEWDKEKLSLNQTFKDRLKYALDRAKRIGGGSSRVAMIIEYEGRPTVLKVAKNKKGLAQNEAEIDILKDGYIGRLPIVIPLIDYDKTNKQPVWLQTELAEKVTLQTLLKLLHTPSMWLLIDKIKNILGLKNREHNDEYIRQEYFNGCLDYKKFYKPTSFNNLWTPTEKDWNIFNEYAKEIAVLVNSSGMEIVDLSNAANWGVYNSRPVIIDLGLTDITKILYVPKNLVKVA